MGWFILNARLLYNRVGIIVLQTSHHGRVLIDTKCLGSKERIEHDERAFRLCASNGMRFNSRNEVKTQRHVDGKRIKRFFRTSWENGSVPEVR